MDPHSFDDDYKSYQSYEYVTSHPAPEYHYHDKPKHHEHVYHYDEKPVSTEEYHSPYYHKSEDHSDDEDIYDHHSDYYKDGGHHYSSHYADMHSIEQYFLQ